MTRFQQEATIALYPWSAADEYAKFAEALFKALTINNIDFEPLAIPVADLDLEAVLPLCVTDSSVIDRVRIAKFMRSAILFNLYIPSKKWLMNLECANRSENYLLDAIRRSVDDTVKHVILGPDDPHGDTFVCAEPRYTMRLMLYDAVYAYLNKRGITHPLDSIAALRGKEYSASCLFAQEQIDAIIKQILK